MRLTQASQRNIVNCPPVRCTAEKQLEVSQPAKALTGIHTQLLTRPWKFNGIPCIVPQAQCECHGLRVAHPSFQFQQSDHPHRVKDLSPATKSPHEKITGIYKPRPIHTVPAEQKHHSNPPPPVPITSCFIIDEKPSGCVIGLKVNPLVLVSIPRQ